MHLFIYVDKTLITYIHTLLYSLNTTPMIGAYLEKLDTTQRKMLRSMVGWPTIPGLTWEERGRMMQTKLQTACTKFGVEDWSHIVQKRRQELQQDLNASRKCRWAVEAHHWMPNSAESFALNYVIGARKRGRPPMRWHDRV